MSNPLPAGVAAGRWFDRFELSVIGHGHIHHTYRVTAGGDYILQRVNEDVFPDGDLVMAQTRSLLDCWSQQQTYTAPRLVKSKSNQMSERVDSQLWRVWEFINNTSVLDVLHNAQQARAAGLAFGTLQTALDRLNYRFSETIPGFLQLEMYLASYDRVSDRAPEDLHRLINANRSLAEQLTERNCHIHGDCKVNNLLFDEVGEKVTAIIDFDTAMHGHWAWDFGDLVRSVCFSAGGARDDLFSECLVGFAQAQSKVTIHEAVLAPAYLAYMLGVRFLTDHISGNAYFRVEKPGENLLRAREQFDLFSQFQTRRPIWERIATDLLGK